MEIDRDTGAGCGNERIDSVRWDHSVDKQRVESRVLPRRQA